ncbi:FecCD family ABC transporter permease [Alicyclobacillus macrosporangiidus]|uniref:Iron complex transport system permease protein n=1 Tax=Alicyclobacillus macrosporangiidus TaxID=392015 RepID=A0A1I7JL60_9BACL|nr:iron complex transport system permease protein [Alicyclobacillus macrosporangiidus]
MTEHTVRLSVRTDKPRMRVTGTLCVLAALLVVAFFVSMNTGYIRLSPLDVIRTLAGAGTGQQELILYHFRLPRIIMSIFIGIGFAISGCILQGVSRNALADPGILGINAGASLMVILFTFAYPTNEDVPVFMVPLLALAGGGLAAGLTHALSIRRHEGLSPVRLVLSGIAVAAGLDAAMIILTVKLSPERYQYVLEWMSGSIWGTSWPFVLALLPWLVVLLPMVYRKSNVLNVLGLGDEMAIGLGAKLDRERKALMVLAVGLSCACVAVGANISFAGLIAPHIARRLVGSNHRYQLAAAGLTGALLLLVADTIGRCILQPSEVPTGIVVAVMGAPYFLYLLAKSDS